MNFLGPSPYGAYKTEGPYGNPRQFWKSEWEFEATVWHKSKHRIAVFAILSFRFSRFLNEVNNISPINLTG